jgi:hypothetical protein
MFAEELGREVHLCDFCYVLELQLLIELDLELGLEIIGAEVELYFRVLVADDLLFFVDDGVCEVGVEGVIEDLLGFAVAARAVEVEEEALVGTSNP